MSGEKSSVFHNMIHSKVEKEGTALTVCSLFMYLFACLVLSFLSFKKKKNFNFMCHSYSIYCNYEFYPATIVSHHKNFSLCQHC